MLLQQCPIIKMHAIELVGVSFFFSFLSFFSLEVLVVVLSTRPLITLDFFYVGWYWDLEHLFGGLVTTKFWLNWLWIKGYVNSATFGGISWCRFIVFSQAVFSSPNSSKFSKLSITSKSHRNIKYSK